MSFCCTMEISRTCLCRLPLEPPSHTPIPPLQIVTEHWAGLPGSHSGFPLPIYFTHDSVSMNPLQCSCLENPHGQRCLVVYSPRGCKESAKHSTAQHSVYTSILISQFVPPSPSPPVSTGPSSVSVSIPALQICSSVPFS